MTEPTREEITAAIGKTQAAHDVARVAWESSVDPELRAALDAAFTAWWSGGDPELRATYDAARDAWMSSGELGG